MVEASRMASAIPSSPIDFGSIASTKVLAHRLCKQQKAPKSLWKEAVDKLDDTYKTSLDVATGSSKNVDVAEILNAVNGKIDLSRREQWRIRTRSGKEYLIRDLFQGIEKWVRKFKDVGDSVVAFDPAHAGVPWAVIRYLLTAGVDEIQKYSSIFEGVAIVSEFIARYSEVEKKQLLGTSVFKTQLSDNLVKLYVAILEFLADAKTFYSMSTKKRIAKSFIPSNVPAPDERLATVEKVEAGLRSIVDRVEAENHGNLLSSTSKQVNELHFRLDKIETGKVRELIIPRLDATFTNDIYERALSARHESTATWIFQNTEFTSWMESDREHAKLLWIHGPPGFGKSVICASIIERLQQEAQQPAYFFCTAEDPSKQNPYAILSSWIAQIIENDKKAVEVAALFGEQDQHHPLSRQEQWDLLRRICTAIPYSTFVIDGYDECKSREEQDKFNKIHDVRSQFLSDLISWLNGTNAQVLLISRDTAEIRAAVLESPASPEIFITDYGILPSDTTPDVQSFSRHQIELKFKTRKTVDFDSIATMATEKADGMFLWVRLMSFKIKATTTLKGLDKIVSTMPKGLEDAYQRDLDRIWTLDEDERDHALMILRWVLFAKRPLTVRELIEALALGEDDEYPEENLPEWWNEVDDLQDAPDEYITELLRRPLGSLIQLQSKPGTQAQDSVESTVHLVHFSVREFLLKAKDNASSDTRQNLFHNEPTEHGNLARFCLRYLCLDVFGEHDVEDIDGQFVTEKVQRYPFLYYAANNWFEHADSELANDERMPTPATMTIIKKLLDPSKSNWALWGCLEEYTDSMDFISQMEDDDDDLDPDDRFLDWVEGLERLKYCIPEGPIYYACRFETADLAKELLEQGADLNTTGLMGTLLHVAVIVGSLNVVRFLLDQGIDASKEGGFMGKPAIFYAWCGENVARNGEEVEIFLLLLEKEKTIANEPRMGFSLLLEALKFSDTRPLKAVIDKGVDINAKTEERGRTAVALAARNYRLEHISVLIEAGADIELENNNGITPLFYSIYSKNPAGTAGVLLSHNANLHHRDHNQRTMLHFAATYGYTELAEILLSAGAEIDAVDDLGRTALMTAITQGFPELASTLIHQGSDVNKRNVIGETPFDLASYRGILSFGYFFWRRCALLPESCDGVSIDDLIQSMVEKDAVVFGTMLDSIVSKPENIIRSGLLHIAALCESLEIVQKLCDWGMVPNFALPNGRIALHSAAVHGYSEVTEYLIQRGSDPGYMDIFSRSPLTQAILRGQACETTIQILIQYGGFMIPNEPLPSEALMKNWTARKEHEFILNERETTQNDQGDDEDIHRAYRVMFRGWDPEEKEDFSSENVTSNEKSSKTAETGSDRPPFAIDAFTRRPFFTGILPDGTDRIYGKLIGRNEVRWVELQENDGWMYWGRLNFEDGSIEGEWGRRPMGAIRGPFKLINKEKPLQ